MASSAPSTEMPTLSESLNSTADLHQESLHPRVIVALFEIGSHPPSSWGSLPSLKNCSHQVTEQKTAQKSNNLLKEIKDVLKNVAGFEEITEAKETFEESGTSKGVSEHKEKIRGCDKINKMIFKNLLVSLAPEKEQNAKKQEMILEKQNSKNAVQVFARELVNHLDENSLNKTQQSKEKAKYRLFGVQEENMKLRNNMEQLLQEAEHWSKQHTELNELIRSYQESQTDVRETLGNNVVCFQTQPNNEVSVKHELEEQVRKLRHDTYSLHLVAALLENECHILQQRVEILKELHHQREGTLQEIPIQINSKQNEKGQKSSEAEKVEICKQNVREMEGKKTFQKKDRTYQSLDVCLNKKAHNNWFNTHVARRVLMGKKRSASSLRQKISKAKEKMNLQKTTSNTFNFKHDQ
ncbi:spermatogenic leucine zipper protein 1 [Carlito syrichta]|uniref:Spermatogenic leucine zipper protein 1 n=1 Tax=Carlito syrichta TaxID=1868482 RepID=A0A1U7V3L1_CARSF|nr:spermatogenic leucine zipper protein 1 [Carlito syrichta]